MMQQTQPQTERLLTKEQAAAYYGVSIRTLDKYIKLGLVTPIKLGGAVRFKKEDLENPKQK